MNYVYADNFQEQRERLLKSAAAKPFLDRIMEAADIAITQPSVAFKMSEYLLFYKTGDRKTFYKGYVDRRNKCFCIAAAYWLTEDEKYQEPLIDYISYICDEFSWCQPAHALWGQQSVQDVIEHIDLSQSETARMLAEIVMCVGDKLPDFIKERMTLEVQRRVIAPLYRGRVFNWHICNNNWSAVCAGNCALAALYFATEEQREKILPPMFTAAENYLSGIGENGCCMEGVGYWAYGFNHFIILANVIKYCGGKNYYEEQKVKDLALFLQRFRLSDSKCATFSDCTENFEFHAGYMCFLKSVYPEVCLPDLQYAVASWNSFCDLLWFDPDYKKDPLKLESCYFEDAQWYLKKKEKYSFAACGGNNGESHCHNDVGSFMITVGEQVFLSDLGRGEYVRETFQIPERFNFVQNSSRGHSVPIVEGKYQQYGKEYAAKNTVATEDSFSLDIEGAYEKGLCEKLHRCFELGEDSITLTDTVLGANITERFISKISPVVCDGYVDYGIGRIAFDPEALDVAVRQESFTAFDGVTTVIVYQTDFIAKDPNCTEFRFQFLF